MRSLRCSQPALDCAAEAKPGPSPAAGRSRLACRGAQRPSSCRSGRRAAAMCAVFGLIKKHHGPRAAHQASHILSSG